MHDFEAGLHGAHRALDEAVLVVGGVERALSAAQTAELRVERTGAFLLKVGVVLLGVTVTGVVGVLFLRWFLRRPAPDTGTSIGPHDASDDASHDASDDATTSATTDDQVATPDDPLLQSSDR